MLAHGKCPILKTWAFTFMHFHRIGPLVNKNPSINEALDTAMLITTLLNIEAAA